MDNVKRIFAVADFKDESPRSIRAQVRMWVKGLIRLGHDVQRFSYRNIMMQFNPFSSRRFAPGFVKRRADRILAEQIKRYHPDILLILNMKYLDAQTLRMVRAVAPDAVFVGRDEDPFPEQNPTRIAIARETDIVVSTSAGRFLRAYKDAGVKCCAFMPNACDPDIQMRYTVGPKWDADIIFTGKAEHTRLERNNERYEIVRRLALLPNTRLYGCFGSPKVEGIELFHAISGAKTGLSINIANDVSLYHSDRLITYLSCGTLTLARRVPDSDILFQDKAHLRYFDSGEEFFELARWYLEHPQQREEIAQAGMARAHKEFNCVRIARDLLELIDKGAYSAPWAHVL
ncbi:MAG: glycosyltransferase [Phycisphaerales bacterium]|nr:MAG: glycosyltransferase [Phycisphaerales bacterium]